MPHSITHGDACLAYFNKIWDIPYGSYASGYPGYGYGGLGYRAARRVAIHRARWH
jgi:hypothetical protein